MMKIFYKSIATLALMVVFFSESAHSQAFFGLYGGINNANMSLDGWKTPSDPYDKQPKFEKIRRLTFGATCELPLSKYFFFQPELALTQKGTIMSIDSGYDAGFTGGDGLYEYYTVNNLTLNYIQLPILFKARMTLVKPNKLYPHENTGRPLYMEVFMGPVVNFLMAPSSNYSITTAFTESGDDTEVDSVYKIKSTSSYKGLKKLDFSLALGANLKWKVNKRTYIYLEARYSMNFMNINKSALRFEYVTNDGKLAFNTPTLKNSGNLALTFGISRTFTKRRYWDHPRVNKRRF